MAATEEICVAMGKKHKEHITCYGAALDERLTGDHETCSINEFRHGTADRGASIRIPRAVAQKGYGYLEDRRPGANANPYAVAARILKTIANID
jgi:glutamine synthetase